MRTPLVVFVLSASLVACTNSGSQGDPAGIGDFGSFNAATVDVTAEGGIAALSIHRLVRHDDRTFVYAMRHVCGQSCSAPLDSASGNLSASATDSLFNIVLAQSPFSLKDDYGTTSNAADMMLYTVKISADGKVKTIRADDGTMPPSVRQIVQSVSAAIVAARP